MNVSRSIWSRSQLLSKRESSAEDEVEDKETEQVLDQLEYIMMDLKIKI